MTADINIINLLLAALVALTPLYSMVYDMKKDTSAMKENTAKLATIIALCPNCPHIRKGDE